MNRVSGPVITITAGTSFSASDNFDRGSLGSNWTNPTWDQGSVTIASSNYAIFTSTSQESLAYWNVDKPTTTSSFACAKLQVDASFANTDAQVCLGMSASATASTNAAVCCGNDAGTNNIIAITRFACDGAACGWTSVNTGAISPSIADGDYIGIERTGSSSWSCKVARVATPTTWTEYVTGTVGSLTDTYAGMYFWDDATTTIRINTWRAGDGSLPSDASTCGP